MTKRTYTDDELIARVWDVEEIKKLVYKRGVYIANGWQERELAELWVSDPAAKETASYGKNTGWYVGLDAIAAWYVRPQGAGYMAHDPASTGLVELAADGKTAKALFYCIAEKTEKDASGETKALWLPHKAGYDLMKEDGVWKIWHLVEAIDLVSEAGQDYGAQSPYPDYEADPIFADFGTPTVPCLCHDAAFNWWDDYPPMPEPYDTFTPAISYGPEGYQPPKGKHYGAGEGRNYQ